MLPHSTRWLRKLSHSPPPEAAPSSDDASSILLLQVMAMREGEGVSNHRNRMLLTTVARELGSSQFFPEKLLRRRWPPTGFSARGSNGILVVEISAVVFSCAVISTHH